jgi:hypothetical protein
MEEEHAIVRILISRIGRCKEKLRQEEVLLNGPKALNPSLIGTSDKFPSEKKQ